MTTLRGDAEKDLRTVATPDEAEGEEGINDATGAHINTARSDNSEVENSVFILSASTCLTGLAPFANSVLYKYGQNHGMLGVSRQESRRRLGLQT